jgi:hypothetical protein
MSCDINKKIKISAVAEHCTEENYRIDCINAKVIKRFDNEFLRKFNESIAIKVFRNHDLMNTNIGELIPYVGISSQKSFNNMSSKLKAREV